MVVVVWVLHSLLVVSLSQSSSPLAIKAPTLSRGTDERKLSQRPGPKDEEVVPLRWRSDRKENDLSPRDFTARNSEQSPAPLYIAASTLSGPSNQLFGMINSLALALEDDSARVRAVFFPLEAHYLWAVGCSAIGAQAPMKRDKAGKDGSGARSGDTSKCPNKAYDLPVSMFLNVMSPIVRYRVHALDPPSSRSTRRRAIFRPSELTICSSYGTLSDLDAIRSNNSNVGLMFERIQQMVGLKPHSLPDYASLGKLGVQLHLSEHKELECIRNSIKSNRSVVAIMYDHDLCASRSIEFISHYGSGAKAMTSDRERLRATKHAVIKDGESICPRTVDIAALGNLIFSKGTEHLRKLRHFEITAPEDLVKRVRDGVFMQLRVPDEDIFHSAKQIAKESLILRPPLTTSASHPEGISALCPNGAEYCDNTSISLPFGGRRSTDALMNRCGVRTLGQLMDRIAGAAASRGYKYVSIITNSPLLKQYTNSALSAR